MSPLDGPGGLLRELRRRHVLRATAVYAAVAWAVIEVADTVSGPLSLPSWFATFVIVLAALGLPVAVSLAWAYQVTPDPGTAGTTAGDGGSRAGPRGGWGFAFIAGITIGVGAFGFQAWRHGPVDAGSGTPADEAGIGSIAVLPFVNLSSDRENEHFSDGLTEELLNSLAQIPGLRVAARTSSFAFKGTDAGIAEISGQLGVEAVLEGSVRKADRTIRVTAQLVQAPDGYHLWSRTYERELEDIFEIQDEISEAIVQSLAPRFAAANARPTRHATQDVEAYDLFLQGRHRFWQGSSEEGLREAAELYERAIAEDPGFSLAYAGLSDAYMLLAGHRPPRDVMPRAKDAALRAIELDPMLAEGYVALASIEWLHDWDWQAAATHYRRSFSVNPLLHTRCICYAWYLAVVGDMESAVVEAERARAMDPVARLPHVILSWMYYLAGRPDEARVELSEVFAASPSDVSGRRIAAWILWDEGRREDAIAELHRIRDHWERRGGFLDQGPPVVLAELGVMYALAGREREARELLESLRVRSRRAYVPAEYRAAVEAALGLRDEAFRSLTEAYENRSNLGQLSILPLSRPLRDDPRYRELMERIGLEPG